MTFPSFCRVSTTLAVIASLTTVAWAADPIRPAASSSTSKSGASQRGGSGRAILPDPALLDGSKQPAEKRPEFGMVGDFELPGDENVRNGRVGGPQAPGQQGQQQGQGGGGLPNILPPTGGAGGQGQQSALPPPPSLPGGGQQAGPENPAAAGQQIAGAGDQGAQPQGAQVGQLQGEGGGPEQGQIGEKPPQVSIGDSAMQIKTVANAPSIVGGQQPAGQTQQHEKTTGTGGKGPTGNNSNKGAERGRTMPAGL